MRRFVLLTSFFTLTPVLLIFSLLFLLALSYQNQGSSLAFSFFSPQRPSVAYAAVPNVQDFFVGEVIGKDARVEVVRQFFEQYNSPLAPFASHIVSSAQEYGLDYRLLPAIAMQESNLCRRVPKDSHNCWGFGIYGKKVTRFESYEQAISTVSKTLALEYKNKGLETPEEIMKKYTPSNNGAWADSVSHFMLQMQ